MLFQSGQLTEAAAEFRQLLRDHPADAMLLSNLGTIALHLGNLEEGTSILERSLRINPGQAEALTDYAHALSMLGKHEKALSSFDSALLIKGDYWLAHNNKGLALHELGRYQDALRCFVRALEINPRYAEASNNMGAVLQKLERFDEALESYDRAIALEPDFAIAYNNRSGVLQALGRLDDALASCNRAIALSPKFADAYNNRGEVLSRLQRPAEALASYDEAIALKPGYAEAWSNRGNALKDLGRLNEALADYDKAIAIDPDYAEGYWNKSLLKILSGDYVEGWRLFEWRWKCVRKKHARNFKQPLWLGDESIGGKTIFVHREQGFGDFVQFCRYVPLLEALGANVILESPPSMIPLLRDFGKQVTVMDENQPPPDFDLHCPLMSLPLALRTEVATIPAQIPYLFADPGRQDRWRKSLGEKTGKRVGLAWSGSATHKNDHNRSIALGLLEPILGLPFEFHCLQNEIRADDEARMPGFPRLRQHKDRLVDFAETAALIQELDVVISVDTSAAHLAGALGKEVWILLPFSPDYRWMLNRRDSPWYPTARLFRQRAAGDWKSLLSEIADRLRAMN